MNNIINDLAKAIAEASKPKTSAYDTAATVVRIENGTAWVHIPGGVDETPVKLTINAAVGDTVQVRVSGGRAFLVGNASAPPTDDRVANQAVKSIQQTNKAVKEVDALTQNVKSIAQNAQVVANEGKAIAEATNQYFWHDDNGAHVTTVPQSTDPEGTTDMNSVWNSEGLLLRNGANILTQLGQHAVAFYDGNGNNVENVAASFGSDGSWIGRMGGSRLELNDLGLVGIDGASRETFRLQFANSSGTGTITERGETIVNESADIRYFPDTTITPVNDPVDGTSMTYYLIFVVDTAHSGRKILRVQIDRDYGTTPSPSTTYTYEYRWYFDNSHYDRLIFNYKCPHDNKGIVLTNIAMDPNCAILTIQADTSLTVDASTVPSYTFGTRAGSTLLNGEYSFSAGQGNSATGDWSATIGNGNTASGTNAFAVNSDNTASGYNSYAGGGGCVASGARSHAEGADTTASSPDQFVIGRRNIADPNDTYAFIIGNGDIANQTNSNAFTVDWAGNIGATGGVSAGLVTSFTPTWATGQTPASFHCVVSAGICSFFYAGAAAAQSAGDVLGTLPAGARPSSQVYAPFVKMSGGVVGVVRIRTNGTFEVAQTTNTTNTGRIYFNCSFPVV